MYRRVLFAIGFAIVGTVALVLVAPLISMRKGIVLDKLLYVGCPVVALASGIAGYVAGVVLQKMR